MLAGDLCVLTMSLWAHILPEHNIVLKINAAGGEMMYRWYSLWNYYKAIYELSYPELYNVQDGFLI